MFPLDNDPTISSNLLPLFSKNGDTMSLHNSTEDHLGKNKIALK